MHSAPTIDLRSLWGLDPSICYLNHGSYGACPQAVLAMQTSLREEMEREPVDFLTARLPARLDVARGVLAEFLGADAADLVFVSNATAGVNAVLRSLVLGPDDELLVSLTRVQAAVPQLDAALHDHVDLLRSRGVSWTRIRAALGCGSKQAAWERCSGEN